MLVFFLIATKLLDEHQKNKLLKYADDWPEAKHRHDFCVYCFEWIKSRYSNHLITHHSQEILVQKSNKQNEIKNLPKKARLLLKIKVEKHLGRKLAVNRTRKILKFDRSLQKCETCHGYYSQLRKHTKNCKKKIINNNQ